jgi:transmembrane 9 superfamily protein 3
MLLKGSYLRSILCLYLCILGIADERTQKYKEGEEVKVWVNKVGPYENPQETYSYYTLPFCKADSNKKETRWSGLGEAIEGNALTKSDYSVKFKKNTESVVVCSTKLDRPSFQSFRDAVKNHYWYNMVLDELPIWAMVGEVKQQNTGANTTTAIEHIYTHKRFSIAYNADRVIEVSCYPCPGKLVRLSSLADGSLFALDPCLQVNITSEKPVALEPNTKLDFSYSVEWVPTTKHFSQRFNR